MVHCPSRVGGYFEQQCETIKGVTVRRARTASLSSTGGNWWELLGELLSWTVTAA